MKNLFTKIVLAMLIIAPVLSYGQGIPSKKKGENKKILKPAPLMQAKILSEPILEAQAKIFISKLNTETVYDIPSAWLFEKDSIMLLLGSNTSGVRLYFGINDNRPSNLDTLTLIMVATKLIGSKHIDLTKNTMLEFSQLCPNNCSYNQNAQTYPRTNEVVPISYFINRSVLDNLFQDSLVKGVRFRQRKSGNLVTLDVVPYKIETIEGIQYNNDVNIAIVQDVAEICMFNDVGNCDSNSSLYISRKK